MTFLEKLNQIVEKNNSLLCIGLDTDIHHLPKHIVDTVNDPVFEFNKIIIDITADIVASYKPNIAYYEADGIDGLASLEKTLQYLRETYPDIPVILDAKRGDISSTSEHYAMAGFDFFQADALTLNPYMGKDALMPFLKRQDRGSIILCRTSNPSAQDFQELMIDGEPLYLHVAKKVVTWQKEYQNCLLVVGATAPEQMENIREIAKDLWFLVPGVGAQGGDLAAILQAGLRKDKKGLLINASRSIIYAASDEHFALKVREAALTLRDTINNNR